MCFAHIQSKNKDTKLAVVVSNFYFNEKVRPMYKALTASKGWDLEVTTDLLGQQIFWLVQNITHTYSSSSSTCNKLSGSTIDNLLPSAFSGLTRPLPQALYITSTNRTLPTLSC